MTSWIVTDPEGWRDMDFTRQKEIRAWLRMNGIHPVDVPADSTVLLTESGDDGWEIWFEKYERSDSGAILVDPKKPDEAYVKECAVRLEIDPPLHWLYPARECEPGRGAQV